VDRPQRAEGPGEAPGGGDSWLVALRGGGLREGERFDLIGGLSIGRSQEADLRIEDRYASGVHARIFSREGHSYVEDMSSTNGTMLNDASLHGEAELIDGDVVRIGDTEFRFEAGG
jgi:pSer/pThr/pTyr-binding forkhead associated (FHA) protein